MVLPFWYTEKHHDSILCEDAENTKERGDDMTVKKKKVKRAKAHPFGLILAVIQLICSVILIRRLFTINILPSLLTLSVAAVFVLAWMIIFLTQFTSSMHAGGKVICVILTIIMVISSYAMKKAEHLLDEITGTEYTIDKMAVIVLDEDPAQKIEDILDYEVGIQRASTGTDGENAARAVEVIEQEYHTSLDTIGYSSLDEVIEALYKKKADAIIINAAMITTVQEHFEGFSADTRVIEELELKTAVETGGSRTELTEPFNVYISGIDVYGDISTNSRSDVNIIATVNPNTRQVLLTTTPRDYYVEIPNVTKGRKDKLTHAGIYGVDASMAALEKLYGIEIDYYVRVNFSGVEKIVDAMGGVTVYSKYAFSTYLEPYYSYKKGYNEMNGREALWFARDRKSVPGGERQRGKNQQEVIKGMIDKICSPAILTNYSSLLSAVGQSVQMNFSENQLKSLVKEQLKDDTSWNIKSLSADGKDARDYCYSYSGTALYVMYPNEDTIDYIKTVMDKVYAGELLTDEDETGIENLNTGE